MSTQQYWQEKHLEYSKKDWITKPTIFAQFAVKYFPKTGKLLDLGAGQGQDSRFFAKKGYEVISTDLCEKALEISKEHAEEENLKMNFQELDLSEGILPYKDNSFDIIYASLSLHYFNDEITEKLFSEIRRVLKKDGVAAMLLNNIADSKTKYLKSVGDGLFLNSEGVLRRFFSLDYLEEKVENKFVTLLLDDKGKALLKEKPVDLIRFIGKKALL